MHKAKFARILALALVVVLVASCLSVAAFATGTDDFWYTIDSGNGPETKSVPMGGDVTFPTVTVPEGKEFLGWSVEVSIGGSWTSVPSLLQPGNTFGTSGIGGMRIKAVFKDVETEKPTDPKPTEKPTEPAPTPIQVAIVVNGKMTRTSVLPGEPILFGAIAVPEGKRIASWKVQIQVATGPYDGEPLPATATSMDTDETMQAVLLEAVLEDIPEVKPTEPPVTDNYFRYTIDSGNGAEDAVVEKWNAIVLPVPTAPEGKVFDYWEVVREVATGVQPAEKITAVAATVKIDSSLKKLTITAHFKDAPAPVDPDEGKVHFGIVINGKLNQTTVEPGIDFTLPEVAAPEGKVFAGWQMDVEFVNGQSDSSVLPLDQKSVNISAMLKKILLQPTFKDAPVDPNAGKVQFGIVLNGELNTTYVEPGIDFTLPEVAAPEGKVFAGWQLDVVFTNDETDSKVLPLDQKSVNISAMLKGILLQPTFKDAPVDPNAGKVQFGIVLNGKLNTTYVEPGYVFDLTSVAIPEGKVLTGWSIEAQFENGEIDKNVLPADTKTLEISKMTTAVLLQPIYEDAPEAPVDPNAGKVQFGIVINGKLHSTYVEPGYIFDLTSVATPEGKVLTGWNLQAMFVDGTKDEAVLPADTKSVNISVLTKAILVQPVYEDAPVDPNAGKVQFGIVIDGNLHTTYVEPGYVFELTSVATPEGKVLTGWNIQAIFPNGEIDEKVLPAETETLKVSELTVGILVQPVYKDAPVEPDPTEKPTEPEKPTDPVVKPSTPSNNGEKIVPKTGVTTSVSAALIVVCIIAGFATYMIVLRKKQDVSAR